MDWSIVVSVLTALLLLPVALAAVGALMFLIGATVLRGRVRGLRDRKLAQCRKMCNPGELATSSATPAMPKSFQ